MLLAFFFSFLLFRQKEKKKMFRFLKTFSATKTTPGTDVECCPTGGKPADSTKTCSSDFTDFSKGKCDTAMDAYCRKFEQDGYLMDGKFIAYKTVDGKPVYKKPNFAVAPLCSQWIETRKANATSTIENVCRSNVPVYLDTARTKIGLPKDLPECGCITALDEARAAGKKWPVECVDARCTLGGIKTNAMEKTACNIVSCDINMEDVKFLGKNMDVNIQQNCGMNPDGSPAASNTGGPTKSEEGQGVVMIGIGVFLLLLVILMISVLVMKRKASLPAAGMYMSPPMQMMPMQVPMQMQG
jgi:hypothetical protein